MHTRYSLRHLLWPDLVLDGVNVGTFVLISVGVHLSISAEECSLVESILVGHVSSLRNLVQLSVKQIRRSRWRPILLATKDQDFTLGDWACSKPVLDVVFETLRPNLDEFPVRLIVAVSIESLNIRDWGLITSKYVDVSILDCHSSRQVPVSIELRLLTPLVSSDWVYFTRFRGVVKSWADCIDEVWSNSCQAMTFTRV